MEQEFTCCALLPLRWRPKRSGIMRRLFHNPWTASAFTKEKEMNFKRNGSGVKAGPKACCLAIFYVACTPFVFAQAPPVPPGGTVVASGLEGPY